MTALDIPEPQVLIHYPNSVPEWHHFILLRRVKESTWTLVGTDRDLQVMDLAVVRMSALARGLPFPTSMIKNSVELGFVSEADLAS